MFLALVAVVLVSVGFYRQTRLNTALGLAEAAAQSMSDILAVRLRELQSLNGRLEAGQRVINMLPRLQHAHDPLLMLAQAIRAEYDVPAVFFWLHHYRDSGIPVACVAAVDETLMAIPLPVYQEISGSEKIRMNWGGHTLEYRSLEVSGKILGCMALIVKQGEIQESFLHQQVALLIENVAQFRQLKRDDELLSIVFEIAPLGFVLLGLHGEVLLANTRAVALMPGVVRGGDIQTVCASGTY